MRFLILGRSVGRIEKKKKNHKTTQNRRPWYPRTTLKVNIHIHVFGQIKKIQNILYNVFLFFSMLLLCSFFRLKELFQVKNGLTTSLPFFFAKNLGWSNNAKRRKKRGWPNDLLKLISKGQTCNLITIYYTFIKLTSNNSFASWLLSPRSVT